MKAGRELDALIAEKVMGLEFYPGSRTIFIDENRGYSVPHYSTNIADAWLVVGKLREMGVRPLIIPDWNDEWQCIIYREEKFICQSDFYNDAPLAICEAALKFVDGKIQSVNVVDKGR